MFNKKKKNNFIDPATDFSINPGSTSILLIFVILCLVSFAALNFVSAISDKKLGDKVITRTEDYIDACNEAQILLSGIDTLLQATYNSSADSSSYFETVGTSQSITVPVNDSQILYVDIEILYPSAVGDAFYRITDWYVE